MKILNKQDSFNQIKKLGLNRVPEIIASKDDISKVEDFLNKNPAPVYVIRDAEHAMGKTYFVTSKEECIKKAKTYPSLFSLAVSIKSYPDRILTGDIFVSGDNVELTYSLSPDGTHRDLDKSLYGSLDEDALWAIPGFSDLIKYISDKNLFDIIVEFAVYRNKVGTNKEKVLITELRSEY